MWPLICKDLRQCARPLAVFLLIATLLPIGALIVSKKFTAEGYLGMLFSLIVMGAPLLFGFWFIGEEKTKGTIRLLKILPIPEGVIVGSKVMTSLVLTSMTLQVALIVIPRLAPAFGGVGVTLEPAWGIWMNTAAIGCVGICSLVFIALEQKLAMQIAYFTMFGLGGLTVLAAKGLEQSKSPSAEVVRTALASPLWATLSMCLALALLMLVVRFGSNWLRQQDWAELIEP